MDLDDLFMPKNKQQKYPYNQKYNYKDERQFNWLNIFNKIKTNKKLRNIIIIGIGILLIIGIGLIVILLPFIIKIFNFIAENGISGLIEIGMDFINKLISTIK